MRIAIISAFIFCLGITAGFAQNHSDLYTLVDSLIQNEMSVYNVKGAKDNTPIVLVNGAEVELDLLDHLSLKEIATMDLVGKDGAAAQLGERARNGAVVIVLGQRHVGKLKRLLKEAAQGDE